MIAATALICAALTIYHEARGEPHQGYPAGTPWDALPDDFACPDCAIRVKDEFEPLAE